MDELGIHREKALASFKLQKGFFEQLEESDAEALGSLFNNITFEQTLALFYLLYFIYVKEIPILKKAQTTIRKKYYKRLIKHFQGKDLEKLLEDEDAMKIFVQGFSKVFPVLVEPILHSH